MSLILLCLRFHGEGTLYFPGGSKYKGIWENGKCIEVCARCFSTLVNKYLDGFNLSCRTLCRAEI